MSGGDPLANMSIIDNRRTIRFKYRLVEEPCDDSSVISYCKLCAICQEARELKIQNNILGESFSYIIIIHISKPSSINERILMKVINL
jgi:hypothetical protein